jgi:hypothetical protein
LRWLAACAHVSVVRTGGEVGETLERHLLRALLIVPRDLAEYRSAARASVRSTPQPSSHRPERGVTHAR